MASLLALAVVLSGTRVCSAAHLRAPDLVLGAGQTFAVTGTPDGGGFSLSLATLWPVTDRLSFGLVGYADDIGSEVVQLHDVHDGLPLGTAATLHRWTWGGAWRADADLLSGARWKGGVTGAWGYWRVEDDRRGSTLSAASALGFQVGAHLRHPIGGARSFGAAVRYHRLFEDRSTAWKRVDRYASAALELHWAGTGSRD